MSKDTDENKNKLPFLDEFENTRLDPITDICLSLYPNQSDVLQAVTDVQYWLSGPDPLDFINIYINDDDVENIHYHYVSLGLTDLYGDNRVHQKVDSLDEDSGFGYELTIRIRRKLHESSPPVWPLKLMQALARYTFNNGNILSAGDSIPNILCENNDKIKHILIAEDPKLKPTQTRFGLVKFLQLVGCTDDELLFAQQWSTSKVLSIMGDFEELGGKYLFTDLNRRKSIIELKPDLKNQLKLSIQKEGSNLSYVKSDCFWTIGPSTSYSSQSYDETFKPYSEIILNLDLKVAKVLKIVLKQRLQKDKSFILKGSHNQTLIFIPQNFKNKESYVNTNNQLMANLTECQLFLNKKSIKILYNFLKKSTNELNDESKLKSTQATIKEQFLLGKNDQIITLVLNINY